MKQKLYILGLISVLIVFMGAIYKINHLPGAGVMLITGITTLVVLFLPLALSDHYRTYGKKSERLLYIVTYLTCFVVFTGMLFKLMHWPYAGIFMIFALPFPYVVFLPVFLVVTSKNKNFNIYNTVFILFLLALNSVFSALLSLNVTSERVADSYHLSRNYINQQRGLSQLDVNQNGNAIAIKVDEALRSVNECRSRVLRLDGKTTEEWKRDPGNIARPDIRGSVATGFREEDKQYAKKLHDDVEQLIKIMNVTPGYELLARHAQEILNFKYSTSDDADWYEQVFNDFLSWVLIYLDSLESNLILIKTMSV
jgi:hypothetical protein